MRPILTPRTSRLLEINLMTSAIRRLLGRPVLFKLPRPGRPPVLFHGHRLARATDWSLRYRGWVTVEMFETKAGQIVLHIAKRRLDPRMTDVSIRVHPTFAEAVASATSFTGTVQQLLEEVLAEAASRNEDYQRHWQPEVIQ